MIEKPPALLGRQPIPQSHADAPHPLHTANARRQFGTQETSIGSLVRYAPNRGKPKVDGGRRVVPVFKVNTVAEDDGA